MPEMTEQPQSRWQRIVTLGAGLALLIAVGLLLVDQLQQTSATAGGPEMRLNVTDPDNVCLEGTCQLELGQEFKLAVEIVVLPGTGYTAIQSYIDFGSELSYDFDAALAADEVVWPDCDDSTAVKGRAEGKLNDLGTPINDNIGNPTFNDPTEGVIHHGCLSGLLPPLPVSFYSDIIVEINLACSSIDTFTEVILRSTEDLLAGTSGSAFALLDPISIRTIITIPKVSNLTIICGDPPTPTPRPTITPGGPTLTPTLAPTQTPAVTSTPTPAVTATPAVTPTPAVTATPAVMATPTPVQRRPCGDVNGDGVVNSQDALWVLWLATGILDFIPFPDDLNGDGVVGPIDALLILQIEAGLYICR